MKSKFYKEGNKKLILFFNGWGMDELIVSHLDRTGYDLLVLYDYRDLDITFPDFSSYDEFFVVGWSMGVMISSLFDDIDAKRIAINGTLKPIDDKYGIPEKIYKLTVRGFNERSCEKFMRRMFEDVPPIQTFSNRAFEDVKEELENLIGVEAKYISYDRKLISDNDVIIPTENQKNYWRNYELIRGGHCPFFNYTSWSELL